MNSTFLTTEEVAELLRTPTETVRYWRHVGKGPKSLKVGRRVLYPMADLDAYLTSLLCEPGQALPAPRALAEHRPGRFCRGCGEEWPCSEVQAQTKEFAEEQRASGPWEYIEDDAERNGRADLRHQRALNSICPTCGAQSGEECKTETGQRVYQMHSPRWARIVC